MISDIFGVINILFPYRKMPNHMSHANTSMIMMVNSRRHLIIVEFCDLPSVLSLYGASRHRKRIHVIKFFTFSLYQYFYTSLTSPFVNICILSVNKYCNIIGEYVNQVTSKPIASSILLHRFFSFELFAPQGINICQK